jgi:hypothetical protein
VGPRCLLGKMNAEAQEQAVNGTSLDLVPMPTCLREMLERLREAHDEDQSGKEFAEARGYMQQLDRMANGLVDVMEQQASRTLMGHLAERVRDSDDTLAQFAQVEAELRYCKM